LYTNFIFILFYAFLKMENEFDSLKNKKNTYKSKYYALFVLIYMF
jgi:hypothetical protein